MSKWARRTVIAAQALWSLSADEVAAQIGRNRGIVDPNVATAAELAALAGMTKAVAESILEQRPFPTVLALDELLRKSLGDKQRRALYEKMFVHIDLNAATRPEIVLVPGVGELLAHEFEAYRPYESLEQFRRAIGKYVDKKEVARLEQYVFVPIDLNTASDADLLAIPGVGRRMLHELKEYRPYKSREQFRREIGKYADAREVARLERYLRIR